MKNFDLRSLEKMDPVSAAYYKDIAHFQTTLSKEEEIKLFKRYIEAKKAIQRILLRNEVCRIELLRIYWDIKAKGRSVAKMAKDFYSKKKGHNKEITARLDKGFEYISSSSSVSDKIKAILYLNLNDEIYSKLYKKLKQSSPYLETELECITLLEKEKSKIEDILTCSTLMAAKNIANKYASNIFSIDFKDAIQAANTGMLEAVRMYNPEYKTKEGNRIKFITYAYGRADNKVREFIMENSRLVRLPRSRLDVIFLVIEASNRFDSDFNVEDITSKVNEILTERKKRPLENDEVLQESDIVQAIELLQGNCMHLDQLIPSHLGSRPHTLGDMLPDTKPTAEKLLIIRSEREKLRETIKYTLSHIEYKIICLRYLDGLDTGINKILPCEKVSEILNRERISSKKLSRARVWQIEKKAIKKLRILAPELKELLHSLNTD